MTKKEQVNNIFQFLEKFGFSPGSLKFLWDRRSAAKRNMILFSHKTLAHPIYFRGGQAANSDFCIFDEVIMRGSYDYHFPADFQPKTIIDCGANIGLATVFFKNRFPQAKIFSVEPASSNFSVLQKNTGQFSNITLYQAGVWDKTANLVIENYDTQYPFGFTVKETEQECENSFKAVTIEQIMKENNLDKIDILKIDIEGSEKEIFSADCDYWLSRTRFIFMELHDFMKAGCSKAFFSALSKYNFSLSALNGNNLTCEIHHNT
ncbi:hypothetical protein AGMMS50262_11590 [Bacteroidia bacterium]|nr:hypothetical protein AGMMS50262_11590 [Bacteroidia bacterium]